WRVPPTSGEPMPPTFALAVLPRAVIPASVSAGRYTYGFDNDREYLGWAIVSHGNTSMSGLDDLDSVEKLKSDFGEEFLYIRLGEDRYVIRDRPLIARAKDAAKPVGEAGREVGEIARARAERALNQEMRDILRDAKSRRMAERVPEP